MRLWPWPIHCYKLIIFDFTLATIWKATIFESTWEVFVSLRQSSSVFIRFEITTYYQNKKKFAQRLVMKERTRGTRKWPIKLLKPLISSPRPFYLLSEVCNHKLWLGLFKSLNRAVICNRRIKLKRGKFS